MRLYKAGLILDNIQLIMVLSVKRDGILFSGNKISKVLSNKHYKSVFHLFEMPSQYSIFFINNPDFRYHNITFVK